MESATSTASKNTQLDKLLDGAAANMEEVGKPLDADGAGALCDVTKDLWALSVPKVPHYQPSNMSVYRGLINACLNHHKSVIQKKLLGVVAGYHHAAVEIVLAEHEDQVMHSDEVKARWHEMGIQAIGLVFFSETPEMLDTQTVQGRLQKLSASATLIHFNGSTKPDVWDLRDSELAQVSLRYGGKQKNVSYFCYYFSAMGKTTMDEISDAVSDALQAHRLNAEKDNQVPMKQINVPADGFLGVYIYMCNYRICIRLCIRIYIYIFMYIYIHI